MAARKKGPKSKVDQLDPKIQAELRRLLFDEGRTIDDVVEYLQTLQLDDSPSRSSIARWSASTAKIREDMDRMRSVTGQLVKEFGDQDNDASRFLVQIAQSIAFKLMDSRSGAEGTVDVEEFMLLMKGLKDLSTARKSAFDAEEKILERIRRAAETAKKAAVDQAEAAMERVASRRGLSSDAIAEMKAEFLGIRA